MSVNFLKTNKYKDLCACTEKLLGTDWSSYIESATGNVEIETGEEEWANIRLEVKVGYEKDLQNIVQNRFGKPLDITSDTIPDYQGHEFATEIRNGRLDHIFEISMAGARAKTRSIMIYMVYDEEDRLYLYIIG